MGIYIYIWACTLKGLVNIPVGGFWNPYNLQEPLPLGQCWIPIITLSCIKTRVLESPPSTQRGRWCWNPLVLVYIECFSFNLYIYIEFYITYEPSAITFCMHGLVILTLVIPHKSLVKFQQKEMEIFRHIYWAILALPSALLSIVHHQLSYQQSLITKIIHHQSNFWHPITFFSFFLSCTFHRIAWAYIIFHLYAHDFIL